MGRGYWSKRAEEGVGRVATGYPRSLVLRHEAEGRGPRGRLGAWVGPGGVPPRYCGRKHPAGRPFGAEVPGPRATGFSYPGVGPGRSRNTLHMRGAYARCREG